MDIIESVTGKLNLNLRNMNNPNIIIEGIKIDNDNSDDSNDSDEDEEEENNETDDEEEEEDDDGDEEDEINDNNNQISNLIDESNEENEEEENEIEEEEEGNEEEDNNLQIFKLKKNKLILNLNEFQFKHIKKYTKIKEKKCPICLLKYKGSDIIKEFPCNHIYHKNCILKWLKKSNICQLCKYDITNDVYKISDDKNNDDEEEEDEENEDD